MLLGNAKTSFKSLSINKNINQLKYYAEREREREREREAMRAETRRKKQRKRQNGKDYIDWHKKSKKIFKTL